MSRRRRPPSRGRASAQSLDSWPLDQPTPNPAPDPEPAPASTVQPEPRSAPDPAKPLPARASNDHYCRRCGATGDGPIPPPGWLRLQRRGSGERDSWRPYQTLGLFCSVGCLVAEATAWQARGEATG